MATPHISAEPGDFAPAVLMPGDPKRAERIANLLMPDARLVTDVRGMLGFTGTVDGRPLSVMGSGMGMPSATIYATDLFDQFGVERIIRVGTCGGIAPDVAVGDVVVGLGAHTDSKMNQRRLPGLYFSSVASFDLAAAAVAAASGLSDQRVHVGMIMSNDHFYLKNPDPQWLSKLAQYGVFGVEMEAAGLYANAAYAHKRALCICTISDHIYRAEALSSEQRQSSFTQMMEIALDTAVKMAQL